VAISFHAGGRGGLMDSESFADFLLPASTDFCGFLRIAEKQPARARKRVSATR
jgi:hypothetical protein